MKRILLAAALAGLTGLGIFMVPGKLLTFLQAWNRYPQKRMALPAEKHNSNWARGAYLAQAGNCMGCHTAQGGRPYGRGHVLIRLSGHSSRLILPPIRKRVLGSGMRRTSGRALHDGKARDGSPLYPAFPYTEYTKITREDSDAIFAYLQSLPPAQQRNRPNQIHFPFNLRPLIYIWRALTSSKAFIGLKAKSDEWNRGAYLVQGLGHCNACHTARNPFGASQGELFGGGQLMGSNWYAPSLLPSRRPALPTGRSRRSSNYSRQVCRTDHNRADGDVVSQSLQYLTKEDAYAMAIYLKSLPETDPAPEG